MSNYYLKYYAEIQNFRGQLARVEIHQRDTAPGQVLVIGDVCGLQLEIQGGQEDIIVPVVKTQAQLSMISNDSKPTAGGIKYGNWGEFFTPDDTLYKLVIKTKATASAASWVTRWSGYITPDSWQEDLDYGGSITITARDNIGHLQDFEFDMQGDSYGLASIRNIIAAAMEKISMPMTFQINYDGTDVAAPAADGTTILDSMVCVNHFAGKSFESVVDSILDSIGYCLRYTDKNTVTLAPMRYLPLQGESSVADQPSMPELEFFGGVAEMVPAVKSIVETHDYEYNNEIFRPILGNIVFGPDQTYRCKVDGNKMPSGGTNSRPEHDAVYNKVIGAGNTSWDTGSDLLNAGIYEQARYQNGEGVFRDEGDRWNQYAFLAANGTEASRRTQSLSFFCGSSNVTLKASFAKNPAGLYTTNGVTKLYRADDSLYKIKYQVSLESGNEVRYWTGYGWGTSQYTITKEFDSQNEYSTDLEIALQPCPDFPKGGILRLVFEDIQYKMFYNMFAYNGVYARLGSVSVAPNVTNLAKNTVKTINDERYNIMLKRETGVAPLSRDVEVALPDNYPSALFYYPAGQDTPRPFPYGCNWDNLQTENVKPLPVLVHQQLLCYRGASLWEVSGDCAPKDCATFWFNALCHYKNRTYVLMSGTMDFLSGTISGAVLREFLEYDDVWDDTEPGDWEDKSEYPGSGAASTSSSAGSSMAPAGSRNFFEEDGDGGVKLKDEYAGLWAKGFGTFGGAGSGGGGGGEGADLTSVWLSLKTNEDEFAGETIHPAHIPDLPWSKITSGKPTTIGGYGITDAYTIAQVNDLIGTISQFHYEIAASTGAVTNPQSNVLYLIGPTGSGSDKYEEYVYTNNTWTKIGDTSIDLTPYLTITVAAQTYQPIISDLATIRSNAEHGETAYNNFTTVSEILQSIQAQIDSASSRDTFDELTATALYSDMAAVSSLYAGAIFMSGSISGATSITASGLIKTTNYLQGTRIILADGVYLEYDSASQGVKLVGAGLWTESYLTSGGEGSSSGGGGGIDIDRLWQSLTNNPADAGYENTKIAVAHIPDTATNYGYLKTITGSMVTAALGYTPFNNASFTQANIKSTLGIYDWALASTKPGYSVSEISGLQAALDGKQATISDLATIRSNASAGATAYGWGNHANAGYLTSANGTTISAALQSLQAQIDSAATRDMFDELKASALYADMAAVSNLYVGTVSLNGADLAGTLSSLSSRASLLEGRASTLESFFTGGVANSAAKLTTVSKTAWGQTYWTSGGVPDSISGNMSSVGSISMNGSISGATSITASGLIKTTNYVQATRFYLTDSIYFVANSNGVKLEGAGFYTDSFVTAGGVGSGGGGGDMDVDRMWQSLTNNPADQGYEDTKIVPAHIPDMATTYGYLKGNQTITLTGVVTGSGTTSIATSIADGALSIAKVSGLQAALDSKTGNTGTVTSVGLSVPTGLSVSGSPVTTSGTLAISLASGYSIPTTAQQSAWSGKQDAISDLATIRTNAANGSTAYSWGDWRSRVGTLESSLATLTSHVGTDEGILDTALQSLQSQIDSLASRDMFDELNATAAHFDTVVASSARFDAIIGTSASIDSITGSLSGNATTASYLVSSAYAVGGSYNPVYFSGGRPVATTATVGSAAVPMWLSGGTLTAITPSSLFSALSSSAGTNLSMTIAGQNRTATLYATYDSASENISDKFGIVSTALQSLQSQVDSVASRDRFDELNATVLFTDMLSVGADALVGGTLKVSGAATLGSTLTVSGATTLNGALNVYNTAKIANTLTLGTGVAYPSFFLNANAQFGLKIWGEDVATSYMLFKGGKLGINMTPTNTVDITGTLGATGLATFGGGVKLTTTKEIWFTDTYYLKFVDGYLLTNAPVVSNSYITAGAVNPNA